MLVQKRVVLGMLLEMLLDQEVEVPVLELILAPGLALATVSFVEEARQQQARQQP